MAALHEVTHRAQFTGVPWMREHFLGLVNSTMTPSILIRRVPRCGAAPAEPASVEDPMHQRGMTALFAWRSSSR